MRALKALVIGMAVVIVIGFVVVIVGVVHRIGDGGPAMHWAGRTPPAGGTGFGDVAIAIPEGARLLATAVDGGRMVLTLALAGGGNAVLVVDLATGRRIGRIDLVAGPASKPPAVAAPVSP